MLAGWTAAQAAGPHKKAGTTGAAFLNIYPGARYEAQGAAAVADAAGVDAIYWNPAGLAEAKRRQLAFVHHNYVLDVKNNYLAYAHPSGGNGVMGFALYHADAGVLTRTEVDGAGNAVTGLGSFDAYDLALSVSYAKKLFENASVGLTGKYIRSDIESEQGDAWAVDAGLQFRLLEAFSVGFAAQNFGTQIKFRQQKDELPLQYKAGLAYHFMLRSWKARLGADMTAPVRNRMHYNAGLEVRPVDFAAIRVGYDRRNRDLKEWLTAGFGLQMDKWTLNYAYAPQGFFKSSHRIGFAVEF
ncbi:MAG: hypothetical protein A3G34_05190 [Candidatus Lindowbacteria bacterium RIFCSPLOWO2_12_FULL_62_27]|nr:MAG: hypothetical protein A3G34_05190 [Candidatus Lindowbacteria bacterium RIFCSPLOWO2_12_FULL_62_27]OGH61852.1 MAG: hypothetical protein A3I06_03970 [Candidatus Lindowbacteria bacterium RIFCSPLOWO2_02_FULL_62_12]